MEPVGRLLANINDQIYDQIVKILDISKHRIKNIRELIGDDVQLPDNIGETAGNNVKNKIKELGKELGANLKCLNPKCGNEFPLISLESTYLINSICPKCSQNMVNVIYNKIRFKIKQEEISYYNNRKRCRCSKTYELTPILPCCDIDKKSQSQKFDISFKLHNFLYLVEDLLDIAKMRMKGKGGEVEDLQEGLDKITKMVQRFLGESNYEEISETLSKLKL